LTVKKQTQICNILKRPLITKPRVLDRFDSDTVLIFLVSTDYCHPRLKNFTRENIVGTNPCMYPNLR